MRITQWILMLSLLQQVAVGQELSPRNRVGRSPQKFGETESLGVSPSEVTGWGAKLDLAANEAGFVPIFDGVSLRGWDGDPTYWRVEDGRIVGEVTKDTILNRNSFLIWRGGAPADFELIVEYRVTAEGNSGINYRSVQLKDAPWSLAGYQADIDGPQHDKRPPHRRYTGQAYEERGRRFLALRGQIVRIADAHFVAFTHLP